jgi:hypothetical protein
MVAAFVPPAVAPAQEVVVVRVLKSVFKTPRKPTDAGADVVNVIELAKPP